MLSQFVVIPPSNESTRKVLYNVPSVGSMSPVWAGNFTYAEWLKLGRRTQ
jgi:hypothetical protein